MVLTRFVLLAAVLFAATSVSAAVTIDLGPSDYRSFGPNGSHAAGGVRSSFGQTVRIPPASGSLTVMRNPVIPYGSIANGLRAFTRINPASAAASAAVTGLFLAVDWSWDELTQEWVKYEFECPVGQICAIEGTFIPSNMCGNNPDAITSFGEVKTVTSSTSFYLSGITYPPGTVVSLSVEPRAGDLPANFVTYCTTRYPGGYWPTNSQGNFPILVGTVILEPSLPQETPTPVDFSELEAYLPAAPAQDVSTAAADAQKKIGNPLPGYQDTTITGPSSVSGPESTTTTTTETGDNIVTNTQTTTNISYGPTTITTSETTTTTTYTNGNHTSTETTTETPGELPVTEPSGGGGGVAQFPEFCDWATVVCDFIDWFQEPFDAPEVDWPLIEDQDYEEEFTFTLAASCPDPYTIELSLFPPVQFNWQPFCDLAGFIKPLVLASAAIFAAFISLGIARART